MDAVSGVHAKADVRILLNQVAVWVETDVVWNALDLRNAIRYFVQLEIDIGGYVLGHAYDVEIRRAICPEIGLDQIFGTDVPCIKALHQGVDLEARIAAICLTWFQMSCAFSCATSLGEIRSQVRQRFRLTAALTAT